MKRFQLIACLLPCFMVFSGVAHCGDRAQWGQWHTRNMVSDDKNLPDSFDPSTGKNIKWVVPLGSRTYSTPVVAGGKVLIGTNNDKPRDPRHSGDRGVLMCFDAEKGDFCWQLVIPKLEDDIYLDWPKVGMCSPATVDGNRVYMLSNRGQVFCLDINGQANGNDGDFTDEGRLMALRGEPPMDIGNLDADVLWMFDLVSEGGIHPHDACHASILIDGRFVYVNSCNGVDNTHRKIRKPDAPSLIVLDKTTGRYLARDDEHIGPMIFHATWSSPAIADVKGERLVFFCGADALCYAFKALKSVPENPPINLERVWKFDCDPTAPKTDLNEYKSNRKVSPSSISSMPVIYGDRLYVTVGGDIWWGKTNAWLKCIDASKTGDITGTGEIWSYDLNVHSSSTPSIRDGLVYVTDCGKVVHCVDADTGKPYWTHTLNGEVWSSTMVADNKVYVGTIRGDFWILAAGKEKKVYCKVDLPDACSGTPAIADGVIYLATMKNLYAIALPR